MFRKHKTVETFFILFIIVYSLDFAVILKISFSGSVRKNKITNNVSRRIKSLARIVLQILNDIFWFQTADYLLKPDILCYFASSFIPAHGHCSTISSFCMDCLLPKTLIRRHVVYNYFTVCIYCIFDTKTLFINI